MKLFLTVLLQTALLLGMFAPSSAYAAGPEDIFEAEGKLSAPLQALKQWQVMIKTFATDMDQTLSPNTRTWHAFMRSIEDNTPEQQILKVNLWFNAFPYKPDDYVYGESDYWASPTEFLEYGGDCEDYTIIKYITLRLLGFSADSLKIATVYDVYSGTDHALLLVKHDDEHYVLDNRENLTTPDFYTKRYKPHYIFNEEKFWTYDSPMIVRSARKNQEADVQTGNR
jgi:predicted transglutaminase-like cysteine proteinase